MKQLRTLLAVLVASSASALAQVPANDNFANRIVLTGVFATTNGTTVNATSEAGEPEPFFNMNRSVWYEWTAPASAAVTISESGTFRPVLGAYTGTAVNNLNQVALASPGNGVNSIAINFNAVGGTSYKIIVDGRQGVSGTFSLVVSQAISGPLVSLTAPINGRSFTNPVNVALSANVSTPLGGTVTNVSSSIRATS